MTSSRLPISVNGNAVPGASMALSDDVFLVEAGRQCLVYAPLTRVAFVAPLPACELRKALVAGPMRRLVETQAVRVVRTRLRATESGAAKPSEPAPTRPFRPTAVTLFLTTECNMRCRYCYASAGGADPVTMPFEIAKAAVEVVVANAAAAGAPAIDLAFHGGGEPTIAWDALIATYQFATRLAKDRGFGVSVMVATNGILSERKLDWILRHAVGASVSFDGLPEFQDANRPLSSGRGSSEQVLRTIAVMDRSQFTYGLRVTVTNENVTRMADSVSFICERFRPVTILLEPAYKLGRWSKAGAVDASCFVDGFRSARRVARAHGQDVCFSAARFPIIVSSFCGVTQDNFCVTPQGNVTSCYMAMDADVPYATRFIYGHYDASRKAFHFDQQALDNLRSLRPVESCLCRNCFARWHCGGDCAYQSLAAGTPAGCAGASRCAIIRDLTWDALLERIGQSADGVWKDDRRPGCRAAAGQR